MTKERGALKLALAVLKEWRKGFPDDWTDFDTEAVTAIKEALAQPEQDHVIDCPRCGHCCPQPEQEPVALETVYETIIQWDEGGGKRSRRGLARRIVALYTTPPQRTWQALTEDEINEVLGGDIRDEPSGLLEFVRAIEAAHGIKE